MVPPLRRKTKTYFSEKLIGFTLALCLLGVASLNPLTLQGQVFDEQFDHWPVNLKINGKVIVGRTLLEDVSLEPILPRGGTLGQIRIVVDPSVSDEQVALLQALLGQKPPAEADEKPVKDAKEAKPDEAKPDEAKPDEAKPDGDQKDAEVIEVIREAKDLPGQLTAALAEAKVCLWYSPQPCDDARRQRITGASPAIAKFVGGGGTFVAVGEFANVWGKLVRDSKGIVRQGANLIPSTAISFASADAPVRRSDTLGVIASQPASVGVEVDARTYVLLGGRQVQVLGRGRATFLLMATDHLPLRVESISSPTSRRQSPLEVLVDLTEWRRDAIDRTIDRFPSLNPEKPFVEKGTLVIVGGGGMPQGLMEQFVELAGGAEQAKLVYVPCSEQDVITGEQGMVKAWERMGVKMATFIHTKDRQVAHSDDEFLEPLRDATGIWFGGGRQWNLADSYYGTTAHKLMKDVVLRGGVIGGSSAGASIQGRYLARATPIQNFRIMAPGYERGGLGFLSGVAIDQHFSQRGRQKDMTQLVDRYPQLLGIGLDEATAIVVKGSVADVVGRGKAHFYDRDLPVYPGHPDYTALRAGSKYDLGERKVLKNADETENSGRVTSPVVHDDGKVTFRLRAPDAKVVKVKGLNGQEPLVLTRNQQGDWEGTTDKLPPELYSYTFDVDGASQLDPSNRHVKKWLSCASLVEVPGDPPRIYEQTPVPHGSVHKHIYASSTTEGERGVFVYTPPGYSSDTQQGYPTLVLLHGFGDDESAWIDVGRVNYIADNLLAQKKIRPTIIIMPYGHPIPIDARKQFDDYAPRNATALESDLKTDLLPFLKEHYRVATLREDMSIVGLSMGGGQSLTLGLRNLDMFSAVGGFSSAAPQGSDEEIGELLAGVSREKVEKQLRLLWVACGDDDFLLERNKRFVSWLGEQGIPHTYNQTSGGHDWIVWREYLAEFLTLTFPEQP